MDDFDYSEDDEESENSYETINNENSIVSEVSEHESENEDRD